MLFAEINIFMNSTQSFFTNEHLSDIERLIEEKITNDEKEDDEIYKKKSIIANNIQIMERQYAKIKNMNLLSIQSLNQYKKDENEFVDNINNEIEKINKNIKKISSLNNVPEPKGIDDISKNETIQKGLEEFYHDKIEQAKIRSIKKGKTFHDFYRKELDRRSDEIKAQFENETFFSLDEIQSVCDLIKNLIDM